VNFKRTVVVSDYLRRFMEEQSALHENISRKGSNSYYYAHGKKIEGPVWDGKEEPRLLAVAPSSLPPKEIVVPLDSYSWLDEEKFVRLYIDFTSANEVADDEITTENDDQSFSFKFNHSSKCYLLAVNPLNDKIDRLVLKKKSDKFVITLYKATEATWFQLKKST